jgi:hypothetical protein
MFKCDNWTKGKTKNDKNEMLHVSLDFHLGVIKRLSFQTFCMTTHMKIPFVHFFHLFNITHERDWIAQHKRVQFQMFALKSRAISFMWWKSNRDEYYNVICRRWKLVHFEDFIKQSTVMNEAPIKLLKSIQSSTLQCMHKITLSSIVIRECRIGHWFF